MPIQSFYYLFVDIGCFIVPFLLSFHPKAKFYLHLKNFFLSNLLVSNFFILWDILFTYFQIWNFNPKYLLGIYIFNLPIEEILFFILIPFSCTFSYYLLNKYNFKKTFDKTIIKNISYGILIFIMVIIIFYFDRWYTFSTFILALFTIIYLQKDLQLLAKVLITYMIMLVPFFISNGILTGAITSEAIVQYNDNENMGIRMITIPFEDIFYGFVMIALNIDLFEFFNKKDVASS